MYTSLPQLTRGSLNHYLTRETESGRKLSESESSSTKYRVDCSIEELAPNSNTDLFDEKYIYFEPFGTPMKNAESLWQLRKELMKVAQEFGFPSKISVGNVRSFDQKLAEVLWNEATKIGMSVSNASVEGTWNYLQGVLMLDLVAWRWLDWQNKTFTKDRLNRMRRGALSNVWWRYNILTNNGNSAYQEWMNLLTQDDVVQIVERPRMRGYSTVIIPFAKKVAELRRKQISGNESAEETKKLIRAAAKRLRIYVGIRNAWYLEKSEADFNMLINDIFTEANQMIE